MRQNKKTLILIDSLFYQYGLEGTEREGVLFLPMLRAELTRHKFLRGLRRLHLSLPLPLRHLWLGRWTGLLEGYDTVVLADAGNTPNVVRYIRRRAPDKRMIVWYRNPVRASTPPARFDRSFCELWSFDPADCRTYGLRYNPQFYIPRAVCSRGDTRQDAFFVGQEKGRGELLRRMERALQDRGCRTVFRIVGVNSPRVSYREIVEEIGRSELLVDCRCAGQEGMTLRPLEALFYRKKLLTNHPAVRRELSDWADNIFVWGEDDPAALTEFLRRPCRSGGDRSRAAFGLEAWVDRFYHETREENAHDL